jgi:UDP-glucuronate decarboxylase
LCPAEFAQIIHSMVGGGSGVVHKAAVEDDPRRRKPDITRAREQLGWRPLVRSRQLLIRY